MKDEKDQEMSVKAFLISSFKFPPSAFDLGMKLEKGKREEGMRDET
ncbi:MAG: hypothetical protein WCO77_02420 [bacterium]